MRAEARRHSRQRGALCVWGAEGRAEGREGGRGSGPRGRRRPREPSVLKSSRVVGSVLSRGGRPGGPGRRRISEFRVRGGVALATVLEGVMAVLVGS